MLTGGGRVVGWYTIRVRVFTRIRQRTSNVPREVLGLRLKAYTWLRVYEPTCPQLVSICK
jgi:hypothetical protein